MRVWKMNNGKEAGFDELRFGDRSSDAEQGSPGKKIVPSGRAQTSPVKWN